MTLNSDWESNNVSVQEKDGSSVLNVWRDLIAFRKQHADELVYGDYNTVDEGHEQIFAYTRTSSNGVKLLIALNWSDQDVKWMSTGDYDGKEMIKSVGGIRDCNEVVEMRAYACACWKVW